MQLNEAAGSTISILMFSAMRQAGQVVADEKQIGSIELRDMLDAAIKAIMKRGKAEVGQKTILHSLHPALTAPEAGLEKGESDSKALIQAVIQAAADGAENTCNLRPGVGRAKWFVDRSQGEIDPGAVSGSLIVKTVGEYLLGKL